MVREKINNANLASDANMIAHRGAIELYYIVHCIELYYIVHCIQCTICPDVSVSDEGLITAYWSSKNTGVGIVFDGTGIFDYSIRSTVAYYTDSVKSAFSYTSIPIDLKYGILTVIGELIDKANEDAKR
jgi:hypothetical protein